MSFRETLTKLASSKKKFIRAFLDDGGPEPDEQVTDEDLLNTNSTDTDPSKRIVAEALFELGRNPSARIAILTMLPPSPSDPLNPSGSDKAIDVLHEIEKARQDSVVRAVFPDLANASLMAGAERSWPAYAWKLATSRHYDPSVCVLRVNRSECLGARIDVAFCLDFKPDDLDTISKKWFSDVLYPRVLVRVG